MDLNKLKRMESNITGIVIAGGKSSRMGQNKALIKYRGIRLIDNAIEILKNFTDSIIVSSNEGLTGVKYPIKADEFNNLGPIGGLYSCLLASETDCNIIIPCDVPNISVNLYKELLADCEKFDAVIPVLPDGKYEPLVACYNKSIIPLVEGAIRAIDYKMVNLINKANVKFVRVEDVMQFKNINTPNDLV